MAEEEEMDDSLEGMMAFFNDLDSAKVAKSMDSEAGSAAAKISTASATTAPVTTTASDTTTATARGLHQAQLTAPATVLNRRAPLLPSRSNVGGYKQQGRYQFPLGRGGTPQQGSSSLHTGLSVPQKQRHIPPRSNARHGGGKSFEEAIRDNDVVDLDHDVDENFSINEVQDAEQGPVENFGGDAGIGIGDMMGKGKARTVSRGKIYRENRLAQAVAELGSQKELLERRVSELKYKNQLQKQRLEVIQEKYSNIEKQMEAEKEEVGTIKNRQQILEKFVEGVGRDYNSLSKRNSEIGQKLVDALGEKDGLVNELKVVRESLLGGFDRMDLVRKSQRAAEEAISRYEQQNNHIKILEVELSEKVGLLAEERDRSQALEGHINEIRKNHATATNAIDSLKSHISEMVLELVRLKLSIRLFHGHITDTTQTGKIQQENDNILTKVRSLWQENQMMES
jgi:hypothetical protein